MIKTPDVLKEYDINNSFVDVRNAIRNYLNEKDIINRVKYGRKAWKIYMNNHRSSIDIYSDSKTICINCDDDELIKDIELYLCQYPDWTVFNITEMESHSKYIMSVDIANSD